MKEIKKGYKKSAQEWLSYLRYMPEHYESYLKYLLEEVRKGGLTLKDIGTTEEELEKLRVRGCKIAARECFRYLRSGTWHYEMYLDKLRREVRKGGLTLEDIGTTEEELEKLRVRGCKIAAEEWLWDLRFGTEHYEMCLDKLRRELRKGGLTLKDIGTTEEELEKLSTIKE